MPITAATLKFRNYASLIIPLETVLAVIARVFFRTPGTLVEDESLKTIFIFAGGGLFVSLLAISCGLDFGGSF